MYTPNTKQSHTHQAEVEFSYEHIEDPEQANGECKGRFVRGHKSTTSGRVAVLACRGEQLDNQWTDTLCQQQVEQLLLPVCTSVYVNVCVGVYVCACGVRVCMYVHGGVSACVI